MKLYIDSRVSSFLEKLSVELKVEVDEYIKLFESNGFGLFPPHLKKLSGYDLWELRPKNVRLLIGKISSGAVVVVGFKKTSQKTPRKHISLALQRLKLYK